MHKATVVYDSECRFCTVLVERLKRDDRRAVLTFLPRSDPEAQRQLTMLQYDAALPDSVALLADGNAYTRGAAVWRIALHLSGLWRLGSLCALLPPPLRDRLYDWIAGNRHRLFASGKSELSAPSRTGGEESSLGTR